MDNTENTQIDAQADAEVTAEASTNTQAAEGTEETERTTEDTGIADVDTDTQAAQPAAREPEQPVLVIAPSVGRKVHFYPGNVQFHSKPHCINSAVPMDATVVFVWSDRMVNLHVVDHIGQVHALTSITLRQPDDVIAEGAAYAEWMPFQVGQARASV